MESLERLFLSDNLLTELPSEMDDLVNREIVTMSGNPLSDGQHEHEGHTH
jgi:Leucine-rich repeat (LRR) protein